MWPAFVSGALCLSACSLAVPLDGLSGGPEAGVGSGDAQVEVVEAGPDGEPEAATFCDSVDATFCEDFDDQPALDPTLYFVDISEEQNTAVGTLLLDDALWSSPPRSLRASFRSFQSEWFYNTRIERTFEDDAAVMSLDVKIRVGSFAWPENPAILQLAAINLGGNCLYLTLEPGAGAGFVRCSDSQGVYDAFPSLQPLESGQWVQLGLRLDRDANVFEARINGAIAAAGNLLEASVGKPGFVLGLRCQFGAVPPMVVHYDDVVVGLAGGPMDAGAR